MVPSRPWKVRDKQARPRPVPRLALFGDNRGPVTREELRAEIQRRLWWDRWGNRLLLVGRVCGSDRGRRGRVSAQAGVGLARYDAHACRRSYHSTPVIPLVSCSAPQRPQWAARLSSTVCQFHAHQPGNRDGQKYWPNNRLQIGEAPRERIDWYDVPITGGRQRGEAEIQHGGDFVRI